MNFIKKDISWMYDRSPRFKELVYFLEKKDVFSSGGFIAGGFLRRLYLQPNLIEDIILKEDNKDTNPFSTIFDDTPSGLLFDLDIFCINYSSVTKIKENLNINETSFGGFAWQKVLRFNLGNDKLTIKTQLIKNFTGPVDDMLARFDLFNSMIACDGKFLYMHEDFEKLESEKEIKLNRFNPFTLKRVCKYCVTSDSTITTETKNQIIKEMFNVLIDLENEDNEGFKKYFKYFSKNEKILAIASFKQFLTNTDSFKNEDIVMFINKLGNIWITDDNYNGLMQDFATALLMNKEKVPKIRYY